MATSAFKATTKRGTSDTKNPPKKLGKMRRSQSVSAISRGVTTAHSNEFLKRDNPLFCSVTPDESSDGRGRSVCRIPDSVVSETGRRRSVSRPRFAPSQAYSEGPWEDALSSGSLTEAEEKTIKAVYEQIKGDYVDGVVSPSNGIYETVRSEVRRAILDIQNDLESAIQGNATHAMAATNVADIPPGLVNPGAVELVSDIRKQYAKKFEESQERAVKLRADLDVEEHRGQEFSRILKEIIPDPKTKNVQQNRPGRKRSNERKNMSKRLTEEAMAYFDECVSISTFDSSDFSAAEDPPFLLAEANTPVGPDAFFMPHSSSILNRNQDPSHILFMNGHMESDLTASSGSSEPVINKESSRKSRFSFSQKPTENGGIQHDIRSYIKSIEKDVVVTTINSGNSRANYKDMDQYVHGDEEKLLLEMVLSKNRMEFGSLHLCGGDDLLIFCNADEDSASLIKDSLSVLCFIWSSSKSFKEQHVLFKGRYYSKANHSGFFWLSGRKSPNEIFWRSSHY